MQNSQNYFYLLEYIPLQSIGTVRFVTNLNNNEATIQYFLLISNET